MFEQHSTQFNLKLTFQKQLMRRYSFSLEKNKSLVSFSANFVGRVFKIIRHLKYTLYECIGFVGNMKVSIIFIAI